MNEWLPKRLDTLASGLIIAQILIGAKREDLLPTILEYMFATMQTIIDENCVKND